TIIFKAIRLSDKIPVVLKVLKKEYPSTEEINKFNYEYKIAKLFDSDYIIKDYDIIKYKNSMIIIMEDFGGVSLDKYKLTEKIDLKLFLKIAIKMVNVLSEIHKKHIIHKDIKPHNILINSKTLEVKVIDFGISSQFTKETQKIVNPDKLEGTLFYISPEQTGRMNRSIDYRTDFYSLGITFYEMLTGKIPFETTDPIELVHSHIAKLPIPPDKINKDIPQVISKIVMKLISKNAEDRYQSSFGIKNDLEKCYKMLETTGVISDFDIGSGDISDRFQIPEKLYGREKEIEHLMSVFDSVSNEKKEMVFFSGASGIGKSALVNELHKPIVAKKGYFIDGKFDFFKKNIPYTAVIQAFQTIVKQLITEPESNIKIWKDEILKAVGTNGQVIADVIPEIELIIGKQEEIQMLPPSESQNRFNMVFQNFIKVFAKKEHPLVLFIDDLQWADGASLKLFESLFTDIDLNYFLFIGAYRDNEVNSTHPFVLMLDNLKKQNFDWQDIKLSPLKQTDIANMLSDTLYCDIKKADELAKLVISKTNGNPFFVQEFLKALYEDSLITFEAGWSWNIQKIQNTKITDNVVELMAEKIKKLPQKTLQAIKISCCIGVKFYLDTLSLVIGKSENETFEELREAINEGLIVKVEDSIRFVHDKVREAAYSIISDEEQMDLHYKIGKLLLEKIGVTSHESSIFTVVNQLNICKDKLSKEEKSKLSELNYQAGLKAKSSAAFEAASDFFKKSADLLSSDSWENGYENTLKIYTGYAETEYLSTHYENAEKLFDLILTKAKNIIEKLKIYQIMIMYYEAIMNSDEAIRLMIKVCNEAG
ncbi:MAG TPA: serine/threonine-protein kinase PknK, partial [Spirochaetota bacterium]|nr:serine/threonine-protein kinase PknK [Spirochaetota bacterium]